MARDPDSLGSPVSPAKMAQTKALLGDLSIAQQNLLVAQAKVRELTGLLGRRLTQEVHVGLGLGLTAHSSYVCRETESLNLTLDWRKKII